MRLLLRLLTRAFACPVPDLAALATGVRFGELLLAFLSTEPFPCCLPPPPRSPPPRLEPSPARRFSFMRTVHSSSDSKSLGFSFSCAAVLRLYTTGSRPGTSSRDNVEMSSIVSMDMASCEYFAGTTHKSLVTRSSSSTDLP